LGASSSRPTANGFGAWRFISLVGKSYGRATSFDEAKAAFRQWGYTMQAEGDSTGDKECRRLFFPLSSSWPSHRPLSREAEFFRPGLRTTSTTTAPGTASTAIGLGFRAPGCPRATAGARRMSMARTRAIAESRGYSAFAQYPVQHHVGGGNNGSGCLPRVRFAIDSVEKVSGCDARRLLIQSLRED
jgi:hypothetical protein